MPKTFDEFLAEKYGEEYIKDTLNTNININENSNENIQQIKTFDEFLAEKYGPATVSSYDQAKSVVFNNINERLINIEREQLNKEITAKNERTKELQEAYKNAYGSTIRNIEKVKVAANEYLYKEEFTKRVFSGIMTHIINESLLLDVDQYKSLNENYITEIKSRVDKLIENSDLNITNPKLTPIFNLIKRSIPANYTEYSLMEENDIRDITSNIISQSSAAKTLNDLTVDVREKVADTILKDTEATAKTYSDMHDVNATVDEINAKYGVPAEPNIDDEPVDDTNQSNVVEESYCTGLLETLTLNEAKMMIANTGTYNDDLAMANAIKFITVLEAFNATGLLTVTNEDYKEIINKSRTANVQSFNTFTESREIERRSVNNVQPINSNAFPTPVQSFDQWQKEKERMLMEEHGLSELNESESVYKSNPEYVDETGRVFTETALRNLLEGYGYNFRYDSFNDACLVNGFKLKK